jgi:hypothetical protein
MDQEEKAHAAQNTATPERGKLPIEGRNEARWMDHQHSHSSQLTPFDNAMQRQKKKRIYQASKSIIQFKMHQLR